MKMRKTILFILGCFITLAAVKAQKWNELTDEQKVMKAKEFRADNQKYLKTTLGMTQQQLKDIDNVNLCSLGAFDRISRYGKDDASKEQYAEVLIATRYAQLDAIMGPEKHKQYSEYIKGKIKKE
jgi:hypothetical protein